MLVGHDTQGLPDDFCGSIAKCNVQVPRLDVMRLVVLLSGSGSNFQTLIDAVAADELDVDIVAAGSDVPDAYGLTRAKTAGIETFVVDYKIGRAAWRGGGRRQGGGGT